MVPNSGTQNHLETFTLATKTKSILEAKNANFDRQRFSQIAANSCQIKA